MLRHIKGNFVHTLKMRSVKANKEVQKENAIKRRSMWLPKLNAFLSIPFNLTLYFSLVFGVIFNYFCVILSPHRYIDVYFKMRKKKVIY